MSTATLTRTGIDEERSTADLVLAIGDGDMSSWREVLRRYGGLVFATVRSFRLQEADEFDAVQTTWMRLVENHHRLQSPERLGGWLVTTARRECLRILRQAKRTQNAGVPSDNVADPTADPEQQAVDAITAETLRSLLAELTPRQQSLLRALFAEHRSYAEITRITGIPPGSIGPTRIRALTQLRQKLHQHGLA